MRLTPLAPLFSAAVLFATCSTTPLATAATFEWDGGAGDSNWNSVIISGGVQTNWSPENVPTGADEVLLTSASVAGPVTIDLEGGTQQLLRFESRSVDGAYTLTNGTLEFTNTSGARILFSENEGDELIVDADVLLGIAGTQIINVNTVGQRVTVNGNVSSSAASGITTLMATSRNTTRPVSVELNGVISDGANAQVGLTAGFDGDLTTHRGVIRVTGANTYTGPTLINAAVLEIDSIQNIGGPANSLGQPLAGDAAIAIGNRFAAGAYRGTLRYIGSGHTTNRPILMNGGGADEVVIESSGTGPLVLDGDVLTNGNSQDLVLGGTNLGDNTLSGAIPPANLAVVNNVVKEGDGKWIVSGSSPDLDGTVFANAGELVITGALGTPATRLTRVQPNAGGVLTLQGGVIYAGDLNNLGGTLNFRSGELSLNDNTTAGGAGSFTIGTAGAGALRLQGGDQAFGNIALQGADDTLEITTGNHSFTNLDNSAGGTLTLNDGQISIDGGTFTDNVPAGTTRDIAPRIVGSGGFTKLGAGTLNFTETTQHTYTGQTRVEEGTLAVVGTSGLPISETFIAAGATLIVANNSGGDATGGLSGSGTLVTGDDAGIGLEPASGTFTFAGSIVGGGRLVKRGAGTQRLSGANTYTGSTDFSTAGGRLEVVTGGSIIGTSAINVASQARFAVAGGTVVTAGDVSVSTNGRFEILGGSLRANRLNRGSAGQFTWTAGTIDLADAVVIQDDPFDPQSPFRDQLTLDAAKTLRTDGTLTIAADGEATLAGGTLVASNLLTGIGRFTFDSGTLVLRDDQVLDTVRLAQLDIASPLGVGRDFTVEGTATIAAPLVVTGGSLTVGAVVNPENLILDGGGFFVNASDLTIAALTSVDATDGGGVAVSNGALVNSGELNLIRSGAGATLASTNAAGAQINGINSNLQFNEGLTNEGEINLINGSFTGDLTNTAGGKLTLAGTTSFFSGDVTLSDSSSILLDIAGDQAGEFDTVSATDDVTVDGLLSVSLSGGFTPAVGQEFTVLTANSVIDAGLALAGPAAGVFDLVITPNSIVLRAAAAAAGDFSGDGVVNNDDLNLLLSNWGAAVPPVPTGWNGSLPSPAAIDNDELNALLNTWGFGTGTAVPEPSTLVLLLPALLAHRTRRRCG
ncbi:MAG: autotransporter-associated beta strand repeat-containing protein [Planctomycetota bacterium]